MIPKQLGQNWPELHQRFFFLSEAALNNCPFILAGSVSQFHKVSFCSLRDPPCMWDVCKWTQWAGCQCGWGTFRCFHWQSVVKKGEQEGRLLFSAEDTGSRVFLSFSFFLFNWAVADPCMLLGLWRIWPALSRAVWGETRIKVLSCAGGV